MGDNSAITEWWRRLTDDADHRDTAIHDAYQALDNAGVVSKVTVHRYLCRSRGCVLGTVVRIGGETIARTRDNKLSPGANQARSVESARRKNTLDGDRHWPGHTFDVPALATCGPRAGMDMSCRHTLATVLAVDVLAVTDGVTPGRPGKPTLL